MKYILFILFLTSCICISYGFYIKPSDIKLGDLLIGLSIAIGFLITMPLFIFHRWKNKKVNDYMLTKENIKKMNDFKNSKEQKKYN